MKQTTDWALDSLATGEVINSYVRDALKYKKSDDEFLNEAWRRAGKYAKEKAELQKQIFNIDLTLEDVAGDIILFKEAFVAGAHYGAHFLALGVTSELQVENIIEESGFDQD